MKPFPQHRGLAAPAALLVLASLAGGQGIPDATVFFTESYLPTPFLLGGVGLSGLDVHTMATVADVPVIGTLGMAVDRRRGHLYYTNAGSGNGVERMNLNGTGRAVVFSYPEFHGPHYPRGVALDLAADRIYWVAGSGSTRIGSCKLDGSDLQPLVQYNDVVPPVSPKSIDVDPVAGKLYWWEAAILGFRRCNLDGTQIETALLTSAPGSVASYDIDVVNGTFYWTQHDELCRAPIDGSAPPSVIVTDPDVFDERGLSVLPESDLVLWVSKARTLRWTSISAPGSVGESATIPGIASISTMQAMAGPEPVLAIEPNPVPPGGPVEARLMGCLPSSPFLVYLTAINGAPFLAHVLPPPGVLVDAEGFFATTAPVGPAWSGKTATFVGIALDPAFQVVLTLPEVVTFL